MYQSTAWTYGIFLTSWLCWSSLLTGAQNSITHPEEVKALKEIKRSLIDPNNNLRNWNRGDPCTSNWTGIVCSNGTSNDGYRHVLKLQLMKLKLLGNLSSKLGRLSNLTILNFMWNNISGSIPIEIGNLESLELLLLSGNQLTGPLPKELGYLPNLNILQIDENNISGPIPVSFANLNKTGHFHLNNNSISGQIPPELYKLPSLVHLLLDSNNLSGYLPPELSKMPQLQILQLDNNNFNGTTIPASYGDMSQLLKLSLRNCNLQGEMPDMSRVPKLLYLDLSSNKLNGPIPPDRLSENITTIGLSNNHLTGEIPINFSGLPRLQRLLIANNSLSGSIPSSIWQNRTLNKMENLTVELQNNELSNITGSTDLPPNVTVWLQGNPLCSNANLVQFCGSKSEGESKSQSPTNNTLLCSCPPSYEDSPISDGCACAAPLLVGYRLKSPGFSDFLPYRFEFEDSLTSGLELVRHQLYIDSFEWEEGPRLKMYLKLFPVDNHFNHSEVQRLVTLFESWKIPAQPPIFGPYELLNLILLDVYKDASKASMKIDGVKSFTYGELATATNNFNSSTVTGQGGYGKVYKGILVDGSVVAIKRAQEGSLQGEKEFLTEIELLSRLHHRNLVSLVGYCDEECEQMLVYEFMSNGTLRDNLSAKAKHPLNFAMRLRIALGSAKGILYLHTDANPPIFHRDIKASNILLDSKYTAKVADFGLSRLAPVADVEGTVPTYVSTVVRGTPGYLDPEYFLTHKLTDKSDVYSLGVVFLELLTGMQPISHGKNIVREVNVAYQSSMIFSIIDGRMGSYPFESVVKFFTLALKCCQEETDARPSMAEVVRELESICSRMPEADAITADHMFTNVAKVVTPPPSSSSSSRVKYPYVSSDVSGSNLVSEVMPVIKPR
ncbi:hypothetical protein CIPAW_13G061200 [Carya illinoinensis]|uniref:non-specific serine/threonine protein kinase n=2 Tax=Carya illinoinensis TaxID=32201 RepID=A0A8T1NPB3_CARIL|nr:hypothetical protein CIPAW_13G061200 [Carya illinoinensis]KAG6680793.1 hypothetical protein I3842_13G060700 [Carya illinoinensis]